MGNNKENGEEGQGPNFEEFVNVVNNETGSFEKEKSGDGGGGDGGGGGDAGGEGAGGEQLPGDENHEEVGDELKFETPKEDKPGEQKPGEQKPGEQKPGGSEESLRFSEYKLSELAKEIGIENWDEKKGKDDFIKVLKEREESAKQKVEYDLSKLDPESRELVTFLENGGSRKDFIEPLEKFDNFLMMNKEDKIKEAWKLEGHDEKTIEKMWKDMDLAETEMREYLINDQGKTKAQANELIDEMISDGNLLENHKEVLANIYDDIIREQRTEAKTKIITQFNEKVKNLQGKDQGMTMEEKKSLSELVEKTEVYKGMKLPKETRERIKSEIENGEFFNKLQNAEAQLHAYLNHVFGPQLEAHLKKTAAEEARKGYNRGLDKVKQGLHNTKQVDVATGHEQANKDDHPLAGFRGLIDGQQ